MTEIDTVRCGVKSHEKSARRFAWVQIATGDWEPRAYCLKHDEPSLISAIDPIEYAALLPPKPPVAKTLI